jgi:hypothetical protein
MISFMIEVVNFHDENQGDNQDENQGDENKGDK